MDFTTLVVFLREKEFMMEAFLNLKNIHQGFSIQQKEWAFKYLIQRKK